MNPAFTLQAAKQFVQRCALMERDLNMIAGIRERVTWDAAHQLDEIERFGVFDRLAEQCVLTDTDRNTNEESALRNLIVPVSRLTHLRTMEDKLNFCEELRRRITMFRKDIEPRSSALSWLFTNARKKELAEQAYDQLRKIFVGGAETAVKQLSSMIGDIMQSSDAEAIRYYRENRALCADTIRSLPNAITEHENRFATIQPTVNAYASILSGAVTAEALSDSYERTIQIAAERAAMQTAVQELYNVPVEELNRSKEGIRVKLLRDNGYTTVGDVYGAQRGALQYIRGISPEAEKRIKQIAFGLAEEYRRDVRLRLNADNRSRENSELVTEICNYLKFRAASDRVDRYMRKYGKEIRNAMGLLRGIRNGFNYLYADDETKHRINDAYRTLAELPRDDYDYAVEAMRAITSRRRVSEGEAWADFEKDPIPYTGVLEQFVPQLLGNDDALYGLPEPLAKVVQDETIFPNGLLCTLRRYQEWGVKYILHQEKVLLGDEMGLGKTVEAIAAMVSLCNTGATHFMVICPASVVENWCREVVRHSKLQSIKVHGAGRDAALKHWMENGGVAVTTYETTANIKLPEAYTFTMLVVDEAHYIKNDAAKRTMNVKKLCRHAERMLFMTGTALENKVEEMIALVEILQPELAKKLESRKHLSAAPSFRKEAAPVYLRRKREDVLTELPELIENREWCKMTDAEEKIYEAAVLEGRIADMRRVSWNAAELADSSKAQRLKELIDTAAEDGRKVLVFSFFLDTLSTVAKLAGDRLAGVITGSVSVENRQRIIDEFNEAEAGKVLVAQIQAGGTGLNIQSASVVVICEPQWKPSTENQAISRAYRMGQARNVLVYRLLCEDSIDERVTELLEQKQKTFDAFADESVAGKESAAIGEDEVRNIIQEEIDRIKRKKAS